MVGNGTAGVPDVELNLAEPPEVVNQGRATHGVKHLQDEFLLPELWQLHLYDYYAELEVDGRPYPISPGVVSLVPPAARIRYRYRGPSTHHYAHLREIDPRGGSRLRLIMSPGAELPIITDLMSSAITAAATRPARTRADVWAVLLRLADRPPPERPDRPAPDHVRAAMSFIESRLPEPLSVPQVAAAVGVSPNHLARVFAAEAGQTVVGYIRQRRIDHARRLLASTTMSIGAIAASVGIADLQAFNKACRAVTGRSPRKLRNGP
ncbi:MAG TPA: helix-turn-helix transcriptional regulator [Mycobacteriales bacterium]|nr:helix-turn-helix transcriptional regulator [Mycobacteriales bacterium]